MNFGGFLFCVLGERGGGFRAIDGGLNSSIKPSTAGPHK